MSKLLILCISCLAWGDDGQPAATPHLPETDWPTIRAERLDVLQRYLGVASGGYEWFAHAMHGEPAGTPYLLMRLLPELAPDLWGAPEDRFAVFGFFDDPRDSARPLPLGMGWVLDPAHGDHVERKSHSVTLTCAACHIGRVHVGEGRYQVLVGAPNAQIDVRKFRRAAELTAERLLASDAALDRTVERLIALIKSKPDGYFFRGKYGIDSQAEARERTQFQDASFTKGLLADFGKRVKAGRAAVEKQLMTSYSRPNAPPLDGGSPGQSDGSGDLIPKLLLGRELVSTAGGDPVHRYLETYYPEIPFQNATVTDNLSVWRQIDRPFGQLDGSIRSPIIRNIAAQTAVVGSPRGLNVRNADISVRFTARLPSPPYPFEVDMTRARRGEILYRQHCAACHRPGNVMVYQADWIGTDSNRARVLGAEGKALLLNSFRAGIPADFVATTADGTTYKPSELAPDDIVNDRARPDHQGYVAGPLDGIWARAPYLHNGSVPTLRHLLAPHNDDSRRPGAFVRGSVSYDRLFVGFEWDPRVVSTLKAFAPTAVVFDTGWDSTSNHGHDRDFNVTEDGRLAAEGPLRRLDWSGPQHRTELEELLEYLKTL